MAINTKDFIGSIKKGVGLTPKLDANRGKFYGAAPDSVSTSNVPSKSVVIKKPIITPKPKMKITPDPFGRGKFYGAAPDIVSTSNKK